MKIKLKLFFFSIILFNFVTLLYANIQNKIIVKIENKIITQYEIKNKILSSLMLANKELNQENIERVKKQSLDLLIQHKLKTIELEKFEIESNQNQVREYLNAISSNNIEDFKQKFENNNLNYDLFLEETVTQFKWQSLIYSLYAKKITIDDDLINEEINKIKNTNSNLVEYELSEIEILINSDESDAKRILDIENLIKDLGFDETALKYSISTSASNKGKLGWINTKSLSKEIYSKISKLKTGEITEPIIRQNSVLFLKINNKRNSKSDEINIPEIKKNIINQKKNDLFNLYSISHLSRIKNNSLIEYK